VDKQTYVVGHRNPDTDSVCSAIAYAELKSLLGHTGVHPARAGALNPETAFVLAYFGVREPDLLTDAAGLELILVDHNEVGQALPNIEQAHVTEIWEHHRLGDLRLPEPILIHCEPVGATATLIAEQYFTHGITPPRAMAGLLVASILSDTMCFRSPTTTGKDRNLAARLAPLAEVDLDSFGKRLQETRASTGTRRSPAHIVRDDFKEFRIGELRIGIAQVEVMQPQALAGLRPEILREMRALRDSAGLAQVILMITDVQSEASDLWVVGNHLDVFERAFGPLQEGTVHLPGCMSRKKQVVPRLEAAAAGSRLEPA
jgi:manganese-dependent inorganic pyrophosphatase